MNKTKLLIFLAFWGFLISRASAGPAAYLDFDPGARPSGMGSAFTALVDDGNAVLFNPAGLTNMGLNKVEASLSVGLLSQDQLNNFLMVAQQLPPDSYIAFHVNHYGVDNIAGTDSFGNETSTIQDTELVFGATYAYDVSYHFKVGGSASFLYQGLAGDNAYGFGGIDLGLLYIPSVMTDLTFGASVRHLAGFLSWDTGTNSSLNPDLRVGACLRLFDQALVLAYDAEYSFQNDSQIIHHAGGEFWIEKIAAIRGGIDNANPTLGASARYDCYGLDYSYEFVVNGTGDTQRFALDIFN